MINSHIRPVSGRWVGQLATGVLACTLLYAIVGIPEFDRDRVNATDYVNPLNRWIWLGLLTLAMPVAVVRWRRITRLLAASWPLLLLYAYFGLSTLWALDGPASTRRMLFTVVQLLLMVVLLSGLRRPSTAHVIVIGVSVLAATMDLGAWVIMPGYAMTDEGFAGLQLQKNQTGLMMMYGCMAAATGYFLRRDWPWRLGILGSLGLMLALLIATRSTTSQAITLLAPIVMLGMLAVATRSRGEIWAIMLAGIAVLMTAAFLYLAWCAVTGIDPWLPMRGATFTGRTDLWQFVVDEWVKRPWLGAGYASFWSIDPSVQPSLKTDMWFGVYAIINEGHQGYLDLLATGGIVGLAGALFVVLRTLAIGARAITQADPAPLADARGTMARPTAVFHMTLLTSLLVHNFTESNLFSNNSVLAVAFVLAALDLEQWRLGCPTRVRPPTAAAKAPPSARSASPAQPA